MRIFNYNGNVLSLLLKAEFEGWCERVVEMSIAFSLPAPKSTVHAVVTAVHISTSDSSSKYRFPVQIISLS